MFQNVIIEYGKVKTNPIHVSKCNHWVW